MRVFRPVVEPFMLSMIEPRHEHSPGGPIRAKFVRNKNTWNAVPTSRLEFRNLKNRRRGPQVSTRNDAGDPVPGGAIEVDALVLARGLGLDVWHHCTSSCEKAKSPICASVASIMISPCTVRRSSMETAACASSSGKRETSSGSQRSTSATTLCPPECTNPGRNRVPDHVPGFLSCMLGEGKASILSCR